MLKNISILLFITVLGAISCGKDTPTQPPPDPYPIPLVFFIEGNPATEFYGGVEDRDGNFLLLEGTIDIRWTVPGELTDKTDWVEVYVTKTLDDSLLLRLRAEMPTGTEVQKVETRIFEEVIWIKLSVE